MSETIISLGQVAQPDRLVERGIGICGVGMRKFGGNRRCLFKRRHRGLPIIQVLKIAGYIVEIPRNRKLGVAVIRRRLGLGNVKTEYLANLLERGLPILVLSFTIAQVAAAVHQLLRVGQIARRHGSWAQKYIGDAVMAVWVHDDPTRLAADVRRTLTAVDEIQSATAAIHNQLPLPGPLRIGAGVNTGTAIIGGGDNTALGETVNAAFRLESATKELGLGVALGERTYSELHVIGDSPFERREVALKGYESLRTVWAISFENLPGFLKKPGK